MTGTRRRLTGRIQVSLPPDEAFRLFTVFEDAQPVFIDHDHACYPDEKASCGRCVRGLLCLSCNTTLGLIERKLELAQAYLGSPPGRRAVVAA